MAGRALRTFLLMLALFGLTTTASKHLWACSPQAPDPWFAHRIEFEPPELPAGVIVRLVGAKVWVWNGSDLGGVRNGRAVPGELSIVVRPASRERRGIGNAADLPVQVGPGQREAFLVPWWHVDSTIADDRPATLAVPAPQHAVFTVSRGSERASFHATLLHELNPQYDPKAFARGAAACEAFWQQMQKPREAKGFAFLFLANLGDDSQATLVTVGLSSVAAGCLGLMWMRRRRHRGRRA
jgi:hypothetical protein